LASFVFLCSALCAPALAEPTPNNVRAYILLRAYAQQAGRPEPELPQFIQGLVTPVRDQLLPLQKERNKVAAGLSAEKMARDGNRGVNPMVVRLQATQETLSRWEPVFHSLDEGWTQLTAAQKQELLAKVASGVVPAPTLAAAAGLTTALAGEGKIAAAGNFEKLVDGLNAVRSYCGPTPAVGENRFEPVGALPRTSPPATPKPAAPAPMVRPPSLTADASGPVRPLSANRVSTVLGTHFSAVEVENGKTTINTTAYKSYRPWKESSTVGGHQSSLPFNFMSLREESYNLPPGVEFPSPGLAYVYIEVWDPAHPEKVHLSRINDVGPHNHFDPFWATGKEPAAVTQAAKGLPSQVNPEVKQGAGIDLVKELWTGLGYDAADGPRKVAWRFVAAIPYKKMTRIETKDGKGKLVDVDYNFAPGYELPQALMDREMGKSGPPLTHSDLDAWRRAHPGQAHAADVLYDIQVPPELDPLKLRKIKP
jgi:hypothetical protein